MPSRTAMVLAGRRGALQGAQGDPIFGALLKGFTRLAKPIFRGVRKIISNRSKTSMVLGGGGGAIATRGASVVGGRVIRAGRAVAAAAGLGAVFEAGGQLFDAATGEPVGRRRRRMNPLNPRALSRATRRLASFNRRSKSVEKQLRKLVPASRRRAPIGRSSGIHHAVDV